MEILLVHQTGLGEYFLCNGLVNYFSKFYNKIYLPIPNKVMASTVGSLYSENKKIELIQYDVGAAIDRYFECLNIPMVVVDCWNHRPHDAIWYKYYYEQFDVPYSYRYKYFYLPISQNEDHVYDLVVQKKKKYRVVHDGYSGVSNYPIDLTSWRSHDYTDMETIYLDPRITDNLLDWVKIFKNAEEIHVTPSSAFCLIDGIRSHVTPNLFFHDMRATVAPVFHDDLKKNKWRIIEYANKL